MRRAAIWGLLAAMVALLAPASALAAPSVSGEFPVSKLGDENKLVQGPDRKIWVTLSSATNDLARLDPQTGEVQEFDFAAFVKEPLGIASANSEIWLAAKGLVIHFDPASPAAFEIVPIPAIGAAQSMVAGPDGNLWLATEEKLLRFPPGVGSQIIDNLKQIPLAGFDPSDIDVAGQSLAIADQGGSRILTATPEKAANGEFAEYDLAGGPQGIAGAPSGQIAFAEGAELGLLTPPGPPQPTPAPGLDSSGVTLGPDGAFWIAQASLSESLVRLDTRDRATTLAPGFAAGSHPRQIVAGPENTLWVTLPGIDKVGRVSGVVPVPDPPSEPAPGQGRPPTHESPQTVLGRGPKSSVPTVKSRVSLKFSFSSPDAGAGFQCRLSAKGSKPSRFTTCRSPKTYRVKPGAYRFEVRAVLAGVADPSPASRSLRIVRVALAGR